MVWSNKISFERTWRVLACLLLFSMWREQLTLKLKLELIRKLFVPHYAAWISVLSGKYMFLLVFSFSPHCSHVVVRTGFKSILRSKELQTNPVCQRILFRKRSFSITYLSNHHYITIVQYNH